MYSGDCSVELASHICNPCPENSEREFARARSSGFVFSDYLPALMVDPTSVALWTAGVQQGKIIVVPETAGSYDPGDPVKLKGYGSRKETNGPRSMTLNFQDPSLVENYDHYNGLGNQTELVPFFVTSSQLRIFDKPASITAKDPVADDLEAEVVWDVTAVVVSNNLPSTHSAANLLNTIFKCSYLNGIPVTGGGGGGTFDTTLDFTSSASATAFGVTGTVGAADPEILFEFNKITTTTGLPNTMNIYVATVLQMVVDFPSDYVTATAFKFTDLAGVVHNGVFTNGNVNF